MKPIYRFLKKLLPKQIYLYYITHSRKFLSQFGQDAWVFNEVFNGKRNGYFIEIGSADGITINNTFLLEHKYKWEGICVEANPQSFEALKKVRKAICLNICIDNKEGTVKFVQDGLTSGIVDDDTDNIDNDKLLKTNIVVLQTKTLENILRSNNAPKVIDYLSIDIEGAEERALSNFPFDEFRFNCITIERPSTKLREVLAFNGYLIIKDIPNIDAFYLHKDFMEDFGQNFLSYWKNNKKWL